MRVVLWLIHSLGSALSGIGIILGALPGLLVRLGDAISLWAREEMEDL